MPEEPVVYVDIETNGLGHNRGKVIEVAAIRVEDGSVVSQLNTLLDPQTELPQFITALTGITNRDITGAPLFEDIADELYDLLRGAIFVAHNVRFDYSFLKQEFLRVGKNFSPKMLCTVRLSQSLYPEHRSHKLDKIIERSEIKVKNRHRAYDDAYALWQFMQHASSSFPEEILAAVIKQQLKRPALPKNLPESLVASLPEEPGVYIFQDEDGNPLYIGKSVNLKKRVLSHFNRDHKNLSEFKISQSVAHVETIATGGELGALLLESQLIKAQQPLYNRRLRLTHKLTVARQHLDQNGYINISVEDAEHIDPNRTGDILAVYTTKGRAKQYLDRAIRDLLLCPKLMGFEKGSGACFLYQLKKCMGACKGAESVDQYNARLLDYFAARRIEDWPFGSPIMIEEKNSLIRSPTKTIIVDKWCVIADITQEEECSPVISLYDRSFDIDTYKILRGFLREKVQALKIKPLSPAELKGIFQQA